MVRLRFLLVATVVASFLSAAVLFTARRQHEERAAASASRGRLSPPPPPPPLPALTSSTSTAIESISASASATAEPFPPPVPFVVLFESSSGSSWLMSELAAHPQLCVVQFEPIDNITMASAADHAARIRWLSTLWAPQRADGGAWARWKSALVAASVFGQLPAIEASLARCNRTAAVAFGLKARLSRLLSHEPSLQQLAALMAVRGVRVVQLSRRNRVKQALAEYRRLHAGLGQFRAAADGGGGGGDAGGGGGAAADGAPSAHVELALFEKAVTAVRRSHRLTERVTPYLQKLPALKIAYEELLYEHAASVRRVLHFLLGEHALPLPAAAAAAAPAPPPGSTTYRKATPDRLCEAVSNYAELCAKYRKSDLAQFFTEPCSTPCRARADRPG